MSSDTLTSSHVQGCFETWPSRDCLDQYVARMRRDRYSAARIHKSVGVLVQFARWLADQPGDSKEIHEGTVARYVAHRAEQRCLRHGDRAALARLLTVLREADLITPRALPSDPHEQLLAGFKTYLENSRGLRPRSVASHIWFAQPFLREVWPAGEHGLAEIGHADVLAYIERHAPRRGATTARIMCARIRSLLRYLRVAGLITDDLAGSVPSIKGWNLTTLPTFLTSVQLQLVLDGCNRHTAVGRRDYAILLLLGRLGLRAGEVTALRLDDIDWRAGLFQVRGKGGRCATMPLPFDVGAAIAAYLRDGRPALEAREVFLRAQAPYVAFPSATGISLLAKRALRRAGVTGLAHHHSHVFRHMVATSMIRSGATLTEIGQVLRHRDHDTTLIYAKVDLPSLRALSLPWPGDVR